MSEGIEIPGAGTCVAAVSTASERKPDVVCGKPEQTIWQLISNEYVR